MSRVFEHSVIDWVGFRADSLVIANTNGGAAMLSQLMMIGMIFVIFYFLLIRPQQKEQKAHTALLMGLQKGDKVATASGLHGRIHEVGSDTVVLELADRIRVTVDKVAIKRKTDTASSSDSKGA